MRRDHKDEDVDHAHNGSRSSSSLRWQRAKHALRCLIGCNIGEGIGAAIGFTLGWDMISMLVLAVGLAFAIGYAFTIIPMLKTMPLRQAARVTVVGDTASIAAMEITENSLLFLIPGFMHAAALTDARTRCTNNKSRGLKYFSHPTSLCYAFTALFITQGVACESYNKGKVNANVAPSPSLLFSAHILPP